MTSHSRRPAMIGVLAGLLTAGAIGPAAPPLQAAKAKAAATQAARKAKPLLPLLVLDGQYAEQGDRWFPFAPGRMGVYDLVVWTRKAQRDPAVQAILLKVRDLEIGWGKIDELRQAILEFRRSGKKVYCFLESGQRSDYLLATAADEICLAPAGALLLTGLHAETIFYTGLLEDHLKIKADLIQMGPYKGAAESFTERRFSEPLRTQLNLVMDDLYDQMVQTIASGRRLSPAVVRQCLDQGAFTAEDARQRRLVDHTLYLDEFVALIRQQVKAPVEVVSDYGLPRPEIGTGLAGLMHMFQALMAPPSPTLKTGRPKVAVIYVDGLIVPGKTVETFWGDRLVGPDTLAEAFRTARDEKEIIAVVLRVDSPGGSAVASDLIWREVTRLDKVVVASFSDTAASGGYYVAMGADKIVAQPGTITGSIGVVGGKLVLKGFFDLLHLTTESLSRGQNAGMFSLTTPFSPSERQALTRLMKDMYDQFARKAGQGRKLDAQAIDAAAQGRIWTGRQALKLRLVDALGGLTQAIDEAKVLAGLDRGEEVDVIVLPQPKSLLERLMGDLGLSRLPPIGGPLIGQVRAFDALWRLHREPTLTLMPFRLEIR